LVSVPTGQASGRFDHHEHKNASLGEIEQRHTRDRRGLEWLFWMGVSIAGGYSPNNPI
jgi:hypothetical protein